MWERLNSRRLRHCGIGLAGGGKAKGERTNARYEGSRQTCLSHSIDSTEYDSMNDEPCRWGQGLQGELQAAPALIAEGERPQGKAIITVALRVSNTINVSPCLVPAGQEQIIPTQSNAIPTQIVRWRKENIMQDVTVEISEEEYRRFMDDPAKYREERYDEIPDNWKLGNGWYGVSCYERNGHYYRSDAIGSSCD